MKKAQISDLQARLLGDATTNADALSYFSTDGSAFQVSPEVVVYPENTADVRKTVQFAFELSSSGEHTSVTPRGLGFGIGGGALGEGVVMVLSSHMDKLLRLDRDTVTVQPGISYRALQQVLHTHGRFLPGGAEIDGTIGGAVSGNLSAEQAIKYGTTRELVKGLKVVLSDGSLIETSRLTARELNRKKGLTTLEGEIYRKLDSLLQDHSELLKKHPHKTIRNTSGYDLHGVRGKGGSFDLSQVIIGSEGTLGVITEITLRTFVYNPRTTLLVSSFDSLELAGKAIAGLAGLNPSALDFVDFHLLEHLKNVRPADVERLVPGKTPKIMLFTEFDDVSQLRQKVKEGRALRIVAKLATGTKVSTDPIEQVALWKARRGVGLADTAKGRKGRAEAFIDDAVVPPSKLAGFIEKTYKILNKYDVATPMWGHAGDATIHLRPLLDLTKKKDVDKLFNLSQEYYKLVIAQGGSISAGSNDGLVRALYLREMYGEDFIELFASVKHIFDPLSVLNPTKKTGATLDYAKAHIRGEFAPMHLHDRGAYST